MHFGNDICSTAKHEVKLYFSPPGHQLSAVLLVLAVILSASGTHAATDLSTELRGEESRCNGR